MVGWRQYTYIRMNVSMYGKTYDYAVSYLNLSTVLVLKERSNVNHPVKEVMLRNTVQLPSYIKININSVYYCRMNDGYSTLD